MDISRSLEDAASELNANHRLRYGIYLILLIGLIWFSLLLSDLNRALKSESARKHEELSELHAVGDFAVWQERFDQEQATRDVMFGQTIWVATSQSQTVASIQSTLLSLADDADVAEPAVVMGTVQSLDDSTNLYSVRARLRGSYAEDHVIGLVAAVEDFEPLLRIEELTIDVAEPKKKTANDVAKPKRSTKKSRGSERKADTRNKDRKRKANNRFSIGVVAYLSGDDS